MMLKKLFFLTVILTAFSGISQIPSGYYDDADGLTGEALKAALNNIIDGHTELSYDDCWDALKITDQDPDNSSNIIGIYSRFSINAAAEYAGADGWNREHVWAKSRGDFGTSKGPGTDIHHLRASDVSTNSARGNKAFDNGGTTYVDASGTHSGTTPVKRDSDSWEPGDDQKGDVARMIFYMATRYEGENGEVDLELTELVLDNTDKQPIHGKLSTLLVWHEDDPVDQVERDRNDAIYGIQGNRNPFIDHPEYVDEIWGEGGGSDSPDIDVTASGTLDFGDVEAGQSSSSQSYEVSGSNLEGDITVSVSSPFELSLNNSSWTNAVTVTQALAESGGDEVFVRFSPSIQNNQTYNLTIAHTSSNASTVNVSVTGTESTLVVDDVSDVRSGSNGSEFTIEGIVTTPDYGLTNGQYFVQDETGGINIFDGGNQGAVSYGDAVRITGVRATYNNLVELEPSSVEVLSSGNAVPDHEVITESDVSTSSAFLGSLVKIGGVTLDNSSEWPTSSNSSGTNVNATVGATSFIIRIDDASFYDATSAPSGTLIVAGILTRFSDDIQIMPFFDGDVLESADDPPVLTASEDEIEFPTTTENTTSSAISFNISGADLTENVSVSLTGAFEISTEEGGSYGSSLNLSIVDGSLNQDVFVRFIPTTAGEKAGSITITSSGEEEIVDLSGTASSEVVPDPEVSLSVSSIEFGEVAFGNSGDGNYTLSAVNLTNDLTISPPEQVTLSLGAAFDGQIYTNNSPLTLTPVEGSIGTTTLFARYTPDADDESSLSGSITHVSTGVNESIAVSGSELEEATIPTAWISEFHYDNEGQDQNEFVEIYVENPDNFDLSLFTVELIDEDGSVYSSFLGSSMDTESEEYFYRDFGGIKNGPNGIKLKYGTEVIDFISYEAVIAGADLLSVEEGDNTSENTSIQLCCAGDERASMVWTAGAVATPGEPNQSNPLGLTSEHVWVYPNPVQDEIHLARDMEHMSVLLSDASGKQLMMAEGNSNSVEEVLNVHIKSLNKGIYLLKISNQTSTEVIRIRLH